MKRRTFLKVATLALTALLVLSFAACSSAPAGKVINVYGSTSVEPLANSLGEAYKTKTGVSVKVQGVGSSQGIKAIMDGTTDIGTSSRELTTEEAASGIVKHVIAIDGIVLITNPANKVADLTMDQAAKIFSGEIKNWKDVGGADKAIVVVNREESSGTRTAVQELLKLEVKNADGTKTSLLTKEGLTSGSQGEVKTTVAGNPDAIGYVSLATVDTTVKGLKIGGVEPTINDIKANTYPLKRDFLMLTKVENADVKAFIDYILSAEGQALVVNDKYIAVS